MRISAATGSSAYTLQNNQLIRQFPRTAAARGVG
jgi:hypothetical protein